MRLISLFILLLLMPGCTNKPGNARTTKTVIDNSQASAPVPMKNGVPTELPPGTIYERTEADVVQPTPADTEATISIDALGDIMISTGKGILLESLSVGLTSPWITLVFGTILFIVGGIIWLSKKRAVNILASGGGAGSITLLASQLPNGSGLLIMATGGVIAVLPWFLAKYGWIIGLSAFIVIIPLAIKFIFNLLTRKNTYHEQSTKNDSEGEG